MEVTGLATMMRRHARAGRVVWIGLRPARRACVVPVDIARLDPDGLTGDHGRAGKRAVTVIQAEHLAVIAALLGRSVGWAGLRRDIVIEGIDLAGFRKGSLRVGGAVLHLEGPCPPCSRMEETFGPGGYSAVRGHGGYYASVVSGGDVAVGDQAGAA